MNETSDRRKLLALNELENLDGQISKAKENLERKRLELENLKSKLRKNKKKFLKNK